MGGGSHNDDCIPPSTWQWLLREWGNDSRVKLGRQAGRAEDGQLGSETEAEAKAAAQGVSDHSPRGQRSGRAKDEDEMQRKLVPLLFCPLSKEPRLFTAL
jgi:hypothetical protein